eukprot:tig00000403_g362.t1
MTALAFACVLLVLPQLARRPTSRFSTTGKILVSFLQLNSLAADIPDGLESRVRSIMTGQGLALSGGIGASQLKCFLELDQLEVLLVFVALPFIIIALFAAARLAAAAAAAARRAAAARALSRRVAAYASPLGPPTEAPPCDCVACAAAGAPRGLLASPLYRRLRAETVIVVFLCYPAISRRVLEAFNCLQLGDPGAGGAALLRGDFTVSCASPRYALHRALVAGPALLLFCAGVPAASVLFLWRAMRRLKYEVEQTKREELRGALRERFGFVLGSYKLRCFYYEGAVMTRKLALVAVSVFMPGVPLLQAAAGVCISALSAVAAAWVRPYRESLENRLEMLSCLGVAWTYFGAMLVAQARAPPAPLPLTRQVGGAGGGGREGLRGGLSLAVLATNCAVAALFLSFMARRAPGRPCRRLSPSPRLAQLVDLNARARPAARPLPARPAPPRTSPCAASRPGPPPPRRGAPAQRPHQRGGAERRVLFAALSSGSGSGSGLLSPASSLTPSRPAPAGGLVGAGTPGSSRRASFSLTPAGTGRRGSGGALRRIAASARFAVEVVRSLKEAPAPDTAREAPDEEAGPCAPSPPRPAPLSPGLARHPFLDLSAEGAPSPAPEARSPARRRAGPSARGSPAQAGDSPWARSPCRHPHGGGGGGGGVGSGEAQVGPQDQPVRGSPGAAEGSPVGEGEEGAGPEAPSTRPSAGARSARGAPLPPPPAPPRAAGPVRGGVRADAGVGPGGAGGAGAELGMDEAGLRDELAALSAESRSRYSWLARAGLVREEGRHVFLSHRGRIIALDLVRHQRVLQLWFADRPREHPARSAAIQREIAEWKERRARARVPAPPRPLPPDSCATCATTRGAGAGVSPAPVPVPAPVSDLILPHPPGGALDREEGGCGAGSGAAGSGGGCSLRDCERHGEPRRKPSFFWATGPSGAAQLSSSHPSAAPCRASPEPQPSPAGMVGGGACGLLASPNSSSLSSIASQALLGRASRGPSPPAAPPRARGPLPSREPALVLPLLQPPLETPRAPPEAPASPHPAPTRTPPRGPAPSLPPGAFRAARLPPRPPEA